jgi:TP901 family phage tail tape measure protein
LAQQDLVASLLLKLEDQLSGPLRGLNDMLDRVSRAARGITMSGLNAAGDLVEGLAKKLGVTNEALGRMKTLAREAGDAFGTMARQVGAGMARAAEEARGLPGRFNKLGEAGSNLVNKGFGAAAESFAVYAPIEKYAERDKLLRSIGIMEHLSGPALEAEIRRLNTLVNRDALANGQTSNSVAEAYKDLRGQGLPPAAIDGIISAHTKAATAYGISPGALGPLTGALVGNLKIAPNETDTGAALSAIATATQQGRFKIEDFAHAFPGLSGTAASLGMTGRGTVNTLAAAAEISAKTATDPTQAGVNLQDLLGYITSNREDNLARKKLGLDMPALLAKAQAAGTDPFDAYLNEIKKLTAGKKPLEQAEIISHLVTNQQARLALIALVQHNDEFEQLRKALAGINAEKLKLDQTSAMAGPAVQLAQLQETLHQLTLTLGQGFMPVLGPITTALQWLNEKLTYLNTNFPKTTSYVLSGIAGMLALAAVITLLGAIVPVFTAGWGVMAGVFNVARFAAGGFFNALKYGLFVLEYFTGIGAVTVGAIAAIAAVIAFAAIDIYEHWSRFAGFFAGMWTGVKDVFAGFLQFLSGVFNGDMTRAIGGLEKAWGGLGGFFTNLWGAIKQLFVDFGNWVDGWTAGLAGRIVHGIGGALASVGSTLDQYVNNSASWARTHVGLSPIVPGGVPAGGSPRLVPAGAPGAQGHVSVHITTDPGVQARASTTGNVSVSTAPNRGATVSRP